MKYILLIRPCSIQNEPIFNNFRDIPNMCNYVIGVPFQHKISDLLNYLIFKCYSYTVSLSWRSWSLSFISVSVDEFLPIKAHLNMRGRLIHHHNNYDA